MEVTKLTPQAKNPQRINLYVDGKFYRGLDRLVALKLGLKPGLTLNPRLIDQLETTQSENSAWEWALRTLQVSPKSEREMEQKLRRRYDDDIVPSVMNRLRAANLLNDSRLADQVVHQLRERGTKSQKEILLKLRQKGIEPVLAQAALGDTSSDAMAAVRLAQIKKRTLKPAMSQPERFQKLAGYLARKGFSYQDIRAAITAIDLETDTE